ncbi:MAG: hypothetical protein V2A77_07485, partial [Pseudomonadota bacterium]
MGRRERAACTQRLGGNAGREPRRADSALGHLETTLCRRERAACNQRLVGTAGREPRLADSALGHLENT